MFKTFCRALLPNPLDRLLKKANKQNKKTFLIEWNRGLGDIALGLYAMKERICQVISSPEITFITRESLKEGFSLLEGVKTILVPHWKRNQPYDVYEALKTLKIDPKAFDVIIQKPDPTYWVKWQIGCLVPKLKWDPQKDKLYQKFPIDWSQKYIGIQLEVETNYKLWRSYPLERWEQVFDWIEQNTDQKILLLGEKETIAFQRKNIVDLRGKTNLYELISIIKKGCSHVVLPDSGILSLLYYLDVSFPIHLVSLWGDPNQGVLKQNVQSPNSQLTHHSLIGNYRDLKGIDPNKICSCLVRS